MEDVLEQLNHFSQESCHQICPASEDDILTTEESILLPIPYEFREFLLYASHLSVGKYEPVTVCDPYLYNYLPEITAKAWDEGVPRDVIVLCAYDQDYYCVCANGQVGLWSNGEFLEEKEWQSVWHWARDVWLSDIA